MLQNVPKALNKERGILKDRTKDNNMGAGFFLDKKSRKDESKEDGDNDALSKMATIHPAHENFNMVFNIMLGIKKAVDSALDIPLL